MYMASILAQENKKDKSCDCLLKALEYGSREAGKHLYKCEEYYRKKGIRVMADTICDTNEILNKPKDI